MKKQAFNPYLPGYEYIPDGEPYVFGDRLYVYGSHDEAAGDMYCLNDYVCWSAPVDDLADWRYEGVIYRKDQDPANPDAKHVLFAPDVVQGLDGRYYLYYGLDFIPEIAVAVCDTPAGKYEFYGKIRYPAVIKGGAILQDDHPFDPSVLIDDDGRIFLYYGFAPWFVLPFEGFTPSRGGMVVELEPDMLTIKAGPTVALPSKLTAEGTGFENHAFFEASSMRKINGTYYYAYSSNQGHELCYATSPYPDRDFVYGGTIVSNGDLGLDGRTEPVNFTGNNHGGLVEVNGQWYIFYHRHTHGTQFSRQGCAEPVWFAPDGSIPQIEITSCGLNPGRKLSARGDYPAWICCHLTGPRGARHIEAMTNSEADEPFVFEENDPTGEQGKTQFVANLQRGATVGYKYFDFSASEPVRQLVVEARGYQGSELKGQLQILLDAPAAQGQLLASLAIEGVFAEWTRLTATLLEVSGVHALYLTWQGKGSLDLRTLRMI